MFTTQTLETVRDLDILPVVEHYVKMKKAGANRYAGLCPFHAEDTPSFFLNVDEGYFKCFGCGAGGDAVKFIMDIEGKTFPEAVELLSRRFNIQLDYEKDEQQNEKEKLYSAIEAHSRIACGNLVREHPCFRYLIARGLSEQTIRDWQFGAVNEYLLGLPITNHTGRIVSTATRPIDGSGTWKNGPATLIFEKSKILFGLDRARRRIREKDYVILVEAYIDCIAMHQHGFTNTVALCGTSLSDPSLLARYTHNVWLALDPDEPGQKAAEKIALRLLPLGFYVEILFTGFDSDLDEVLLKDPTVIGTLLE